MSAVLRLGLRALKYDLRAGALRVLAGSLVIAVGAVTAVGFLTDRVEQAMRIQAAALLAADLVIASDAPVAEAILHQARSAGLGVAHTVEFPSVVLAGDDVQLVQVKAVDAAYPLRGQLRIEPYPAASGDPTPPPGAIWADTQLLIRLNLAVGAHLKLGEREFTVAGVIVHEPDQGALFLRLAPRVMMNIEDLAATGLVVPNSRIRYRTLFAGPPAQVERFRAWAKDRLGVGEEIQTVKEARPEIRTAMDRAGRYLALAALVAVLVAGAAVALTARQYARAEASASAILRCLGATQHKVLGLYATRVVGIGLGASLVGVIVGYLAQFGLVHVLAGLFGEAWPAPGFGPVWVGLATGLLTLIGFAFPPIIQLKRVAPLKVLREDISVPSPSAWVTGLFALIALAGLLLWRAQDLTLTAQLLAGVLGIVVTLGITTFGLIRLLSRLRGTGLSWRYGLARLTRQPVSGVVQISALTLGITALLVLAIARVDLLNLWRHSLPADAPNYFMINIQPDERAALHTLFQHYGMAQPELYPLIRARLTAISGRPVTADRYTDPDTQRLVKREFNLTWTRGLKADNRLTAGQWWGAQNDEIRAFSVEAELAQALGITVDDTLEFEVAGQPLIAPITSLREVDWDSLNANFFVIGSPALMVDQPTSLITSFHLPASKDPLITEVVRQLPGVTVFNVEAIIQQVRTIMDRAALAVEYVFGFTLLAGLLVMLAAVEASRAERRAEVALLRALGASRRQVLVGLFAEFGAVGALAGGLGALIASGTGFWLATYVFDLSYRLNPWLWVWGLGGGLVGIGAAGLLGARGVLRQPPLAVLRAA